MTDLPSQPRPAVIALLHEAGLRLSAWLRLMTITVSSVVLALTMAGLMAFIQYQDRILKAQPSLSMAQLRHYATLESEIGEGLADIATDSRRRLARQIDLRAAQIDGDRLRSRICVTVMGEVPADPSADKLSEDAKARGIRCQIFLSNIPFDRTSGRTQIGEEELKTIRERFVADVSRQPLDEKWFRLFDDDFRNIAAKNLEQATAYLDVTSITELIQSRCLAIVVVASPITYRHVDLSQCLSLLPTGGRPQADPALATQPAAGLTPSDGPRGRPPAASGAGGNAPPESPLGRLRAEGNPNENALLFELVNHYRFYEKVPLATSLLLSPAESLILILVCVSGMMGAFLKMVYATFTTGEEPSGRDLLLSPVLGLICALVIYILLRAGFLVLSDPTHTSGTAGLSPFIVAFVAMGGGLASERAMIFFRSSLNSLLKVDEAAERPRYGVRLKSQMEVAGVNDADLARLLNVDADSILKGWIEQRDSVPADRQRDIGLVLKCAPRDIFTDLPPDKPGAGA